jgi:hypothetical protein
LFYSINHNHSQLLSRKFEVFVAEINDFVALVLEIIVTLLIISIQSIRNALKKFIGIQNLDHNLLILKEEVAVERKLYIVNGTRIIDGNNDFSKKLI